MKCTYLEVPQVSETNAILLSQPFWMWGAEMGANEYEVVIGNEAVYTHEPLRRFGLLGMDLLRLGLERGKSAKEALEIITDLLEKYGQGGGCAYGDPSWMYHNSFIIADPKEAYVLETADNWWIAEKVKSVRSISNGITIRGKGDIRRKGIITHAIEKGYCKDDNDFDFTYTFSGSSFSTIPSPYSRGGKSTLLLNKNIGNITPQMMMDFLREHQAGICMHGSFESTGSQVSHLKKDLKNSVHWFTGGSLPCLNVFKPYTFPAEGQKFAVKKPGPYDVLDPMWFWSRHKEFINLNKKLSIKPEKQIFLDKLAQIEKKLITEEKAIANQASSLTENEYLNKYINLNKKAWQLAEKQIE
ncbi:MAG: C69 family dipeptidase [Candidatus Lokiarchaeota archaeon]|nr:C69 family dipeptidase [Candidatus Lokiarchaeota archaeon]